MVGEQFHAVNLTNCMIYHNYWNSHIDRKSTITPISKPIISTNCQINMIIIDKISKRRNCSSTNRYPRNPLILRPNQLYSVLSKFFYLSCYCTSYRKCGPTRDIINSKVTLSGHSIFKTELRRPRIRNTNFRYLIP